MSYNISTLIDCPTVQLQLNSFTDKGQNPNEPAPEIQFLTSQINTSRILEQRVVDDGGTKIKNVQVVYTPRLLESSTSTTLTKACDAGNEAGALSTVYQIDPNVGVESVETIEISDLARICQSNPDYFAQRVNAQIDVAVRKMQTQVASQMALLFGWFATDNGETGLTGNSLKTISTKYPAAIDGGKWNPSGLQEIMFSTMNSGFTGIPYIFGFGEIWRYWNYLIALGNFSDGGLDFMKYVNQNQAAFATSMKMHAALNTAGAGTNNFLAVDAGSLFLLQYNRYADTLVQNNDDALQMNVITDPKSGVSFNYKVWKTCAEQINVKVSTAFKVVGLPTDIYNSADRLYKTNGVLKFAITNS